MTHRHCFVQWNLMEVLQEYLDDGTLVCRSGKISFDDTGILRWSKTTAKSRAAEILEEFYPDGAAPDIICTGFDDAAGAAQEALLEAGVVRERISGVYHGKWLQGRCGQELRWVHRLSVCLWIPASLRLSVKRW